MAGNRNDGRVVALPLLASLVLACGCNLEFKLGDRDGWEDAAGDMEGDGEMSSSCEKSVDDVGITRVVSEPMPTDVVWTGSEIAVVWSTDVGFGNNQVSLARFSSEGARIGTDVLIDDGEDNGNPAIAWTGSELAVVWDHLDDSSRPWIHLVRVSADGSSVSDAMRVSPGPDSRAADIVWTGTELGVTWAGQPDEYQLFFARIAPDGTPPIEVVQLTVDTGTFESKPSIAWTGSEYGIAFERGEGDSTCAIFFVRVSAEGVKIGEEVLVQAIGCSTPEEPSLVWTGTDFGLAFGDRVEGWQPYLLFARISAAGLVEGIPARVTEDLCGNHCAPSLAWAGAEYGLLWAGGEVFQALFDRLGSDGTRVDDEYGLDFEADVQDVALAWTGAEYVAVTVTGSSGETSKDLILSIFSCDAP